MVGPGSGWGVPRKRVQLDLVLGQVCLLPVQGTQLSLSDSQSVNIYWAPTVCLGRRWGFKRNVQTHSIYGADPTLQTDTECSWPTRRHVKAVVSRSADPPWIFSKTLYWDFLFFLTVDLLYANETRLGTTFLLSALLPWEGKSICFEKLFSSPHLAIINYHVPRRTIYKWQSFSGQT